MKRPAFAMIQISVVIWAAFIVYSHDIHNLTQLIPYLAALFLRGWFSKDVEDPLFGRRTMGSWLVDKLKRLTPKRQPKVKWDI